MLYRKVGSSGLRTSVLSLGNAALHMVPREVALAIVKRALDAGITHFDTAESYGDGQAEIVLGELLSELGIGREKIIVSTKAFTFGWSKPPGAPHEVRSLSRKYLMDAVDRSLAKLGTDYIDIYHCHQMDPDTPPSEIVGAMDDIVRAGKARYWAVSNWDSETIEAACAYAERHGRYAPVLNQLEYNLLFRSAVAEAGETMRRHGCGVSVWSALAGGVLTGKYLKGVPQGSRADFMGNVVPDVSDRLLDSQRNGIVAKLAEIATDIGCSVGQLSIAWCLKNPQVSTVVIAASSVAQLEDNLGALTVLDRLSPDILAAIAEVVGHHDLSNVPDALRLG